MKDLTTRTITSIIAAGAILAAMIWHPLALGGLLWIMMLTGQHELLKLGRNKGISAHPFSVYAVASVFYFVAVLVAVQIIPVRSLALLLPLFLVFFIVELFRKQDNPAGNVAFSVLAVIYLAIPFASVIFLYDPDLSGDDSSITFILALMLLVSAHDIFAYLTGLLFGRHRLFERISPKKSWEGSIGGTVFALLTALALSHFLPELTKFQWIGMALIVVVFGTLGDLSESMLKRYFGVKDSGALLPGHGGILDRFDATSFAAPAVLCYLVILLT